MILDLEEGPNGTQIGRILILGAPSAGKTTLAAPLVRSLCPDKKRILCVGPIPKLSYLLGVHQIKVSTTDRTAQEEFFRTVLEKAESEYPNGERLLVVDEADLYFSQAGRTYGSRGLQEIVNIGRNAPYLLSQVYIARGTSDIAKNCVAAANVVFIGQTTEPNLLDYAERFMPGIPDIHRVLRDFPPHRFIVYAPTRVPHVLGIAWVENGQIVTRDWTPEVGPEGSETSTESMAEPSGDTASTPDAGRPSRTEGGPDSASSTTPNGDGNPNAYAKPEGSPESDGKP